MISFQEIKNKYFRFFSFKRQIEYNKVMKRILALYFICMKTVWMHKLILIVVLFTILCSCNQNDDSSGSDKSLSQEEIIPELSILPEGHKWNLVWSDEFEGNTLDTTKWDYRLHLLQTRHTTWTEDGASLDGKGNLLLGPYEKNGHYYSSALQTGENYL